MRIATARAGVWSAALATVSGIGYIAALLLTMGGVLNGPRSTAYQLAPSLVLAWSYMALMACVLDASHPNRKIWSTLGLCFAMIYATINSIVYFAQLSLVIPRQLRGDAESLSLLFFAPGTFFFAINGLAYGLMSLAALFASQAFHPTGTQARVRWAMVAHGGLGPFIAGAVQLPWLVYIGALWIVTFPLMSALLALHFWNSMPHTQTSIRR